MSGVFSGETLSLAHVGTTLEVTLHRSVPGAACNEIGEQSLAELERVAAYLAQGAGGARALLFSSSVPRGFCAGADLRALYHGLVAERDSGGAPEVAVRAFIERIHAVFDAFDTTPLTTVAAVHGVVFGGGFELALTCDVIVADKTARFCFPELRLGLVPGFGGIPRLARDVGNAVVRDLLFTGRSLNAQRAHALGLVSQLVAPGEAPFVARKVAEQAARFDRETTAAAKAFAKPVPREWLARERDTFCRLFTSPVVEAALQKFVHSTDARPYLP
jgi:enoyl-CoA hydratase/carnithine racemase